MEWQGILGTNYCLSLFSPEGIPLQFYVPPHRLKHTLRACIEKGGGKVYNVATEGCMRLLLPGIECKLTQMIACEFVLDSIKKNLLQNKDDYIVTKGMKFVRKVSSLDGSEYHKGKTPFTIGDDESILRFMMDDKRYLSAGGNKVWKLAESNRITIHSWQSMKDRFKKHITQNIESYTFPCSSTRSMMKSFFSSKPIKPPMWRRGFLSSIGLTKTCKSGSNANKKDMKFSKNSLVMLNDQEGLQMQETSLTGQKDQENNVLTCHSSEVPLDNSKISECITSSEFEGFLRRSNCAPSGLMPESQSTFYSSLTSVLMEFKDVQDNIRACIQERIESSNESQFLTINCMVAENNCYLDSSKVFVKPAWSQIPERVAYMNKKKKEICQSEVCQKLSNAHSEQFGVDIMKLKLALEWLNVPTWVLNGALYFNNGNLDQAISWLLNYPDKSKTVTFNHEDDGLLLEKKHMDLLITKYGGDVVQRRHDFLKRLISFGQ